MNNRFKVQFFGGNHGETFGKVEAHLVAKNTCSSGACSVGFGYTIGLNVTNEVQVLLHGKAFHQK